MRMVPSEDLINDAALWPFAPNWRSGYSISYAFRTDIFTSRSGREQRRALRTTPRQTINFTITRDREDLRRLNRFVATAHGGSVVMADRSRHATMIGDLASTASIFTVDAAPAWLAAGGRVALVDGDRVSVRTIDDIHGNALTLDTPSPDGWSAGTQIHPILLGRLDDSIKVTNLTDAVVEAAVSFAVAPGSAAVEDADSDDDRIFNGREVFVFDPDWASPIVGQFLHPTDSVDFDRGVTQIYTPIKFGARIRQVQLTLPTQRARRDLIAFFIRMQGQRGEFYMPTWEDDMSVAQAAAPDANLLWVKGRETYDAYQGDTVHRAIVLRLPDGRKIYRRVTGMITDGTRTRIETDIDWSVAVDAGVRVSWLLVNRFATDVLDVECLTDSVCRVQVSTRTLEDLPLAPADDIFGGDEGSQWLIGTYGWSFTKIVLSGIHQWVHQEYPETGFPEN